jgi:hypothetical protein
VQLLEDLTSTQSASSSSYTLATKIRDINLAFDDYQNMVQQASGTWQADDSRHTKYPNMYFNLISGQSDYNFTEDEQGNQVQDIYRVECMQPDGTWKLLKAIDEMRETSAIGAIELELGTPTEYWKTANGIFLKVKSNYSQTNGIRMFFTRSPNYFTTSHTTEKPGIPNGHHRYLALKPAFWYWLPKDTARANIFFAELQKVELEIKNEYSQRTRDEVARLGVKQESNR